MGAFIYAKFKNCIQNCIKKAMTFTCLSWDVRFKKTRPILLGCYNCAKLWLQSECWIIEHSSRIPNMTGTDWNARSLALEGYLYSFTTFTEITRFQFSFLLKGKFRSSKFWIECIEQLEICHLLLQCQIRWFTA